jgi:histone acetyltransferase (RNA polymerase elongator complex component)
MQAIVGLTGNDKVQEIDTEKKISKLSCDFVRSYPLMVLKGSLMEKCCGQNKHTPLSLEESIDIVKMQYLIFKVLGSDLMEDEQRYWPVSIILLLVILCFPGSSLIMP